MSIESADLLIGWHTPPNQPCVSSSGLTGSLNAKLKPHTDLGWEKSVEPILDQAPQMPSVRVELIHSVGKILAEEVRADSDYPPYDRCTVDGYACRRSELDSWLKVEGYLQAGSKSSLKLKSGTCARVMTGARMPNGADYVIPQEAVQRNDNGWIRASSIDEADNVSYRANFMDAGQLVLKAGTLIQAHHIGTLAAAGRTDLLVSASPSVGLLTVGDELFPIKHRLGKAGIRDINAYQLCAMLQCIGASVRLENRLPDNPDMIKSALEKSFAENDLTIICGGTSKGDYDFTRLVFNDLQSAETLIHLGRLAMFVEKLGHPCFGLPGKDMSAFITAELLLKPFIFHMMGHHFRSCTVRSPLLNSIKRHECIWDNWAPVKFEESGVRPLIRPRKGPIWEDVQGIMFFPPNQGSLKEGTIVIVIPLPVE